MTTVKRRIAASTADKAYEKRRGYCRDLWLAGEVRGRKEPGAGRHGERLMLLITDLDRHFARAAVPA